MPSDADQTTIDHAAWLRENAPLGPMGRRMTDAAEEIDRLRAELAAAHRLYGEAVALIRTFEAK